MICDKLFFPGMAGVCCILVLIVSIGALKNGPTAPDIKPTMVIWYDGRSFAPTWFCMLWWCGCCHFCNRVFSSVYTVKLAAWLVPWRRAVKVTPRQRKPMPSVRINVDIASGVLLYFGVKVPSGDLCKAWRRILITSTALTTVTASVTPAARPAVIRFQILAYNINQVKIVVGLEKHRPTEKRPISRYFHCILVAKKSLVILIGCESDSHLGNYASYDWP